mgnify:CR=1 FL=1
MAYNLLKGKRGIIFGALDENSIAWKTAEQVHAEGGSFVLTNAPIAMRMGQINELANKTNSEIIPAGEVLCQVTLKNDALDMDSLERFTSMNIATGLTPTRDKALTALR